MRTLATKQHILEGSGYVYNFDREIYFNRKAKKDAKREDRARRRAAGLPDEPDEPTEQADGSEAPITE